MPASDYRTRAIDEFGRKCTVCGATEEIVVHHRDGDRSNNNISNLTPVCTKCHGEIHGRSAEVANLVRELGYTPREKGSSTSVRVSDELADELYDRKNRGESYEDVIWRLIEQADDGGEGEDT